MAQLVRIPKIPVVGRNATLIAEKEVKALCSRLDVVGNAEPRDTDGKSDLLRRLVLSSMLNKELD